MKLNQLIAIEKEVKSRTVQNISEIYKLFQRDDLFYGFSKIYQPKFEDGERFAPENKKVVCNTTELLKKMNSSLIELFDLTLMKDLSNTKAQADIVVDEQLICKNVPATFLIFLEKKLIDIRTMIIKIPTLDINEDWEKDLNSNIYKTSEIKTHKTRKQPKVIVKYEATKEHPAQTELMNEDILIGYWNTVKHSGALPIPERDKLENKVNKLIKAVKYAREQANNSQVSNGQIGDKIFSYLFT